MCWGVIGEALQVELGEGYVVELNYVDRFDGEWSRFVASLTVKVKVRSGDSGCYCGVQLWDGWLDLRFWSLWRREPHCELVSVDLSDPGAMGQLVGVVRGRL